MSDQNQDQYEAAMAKWEERRLELAKGFRFFQYRTKQSDPWADGGEEQRFMQTAESAMNDRGNRKPTPPAPAMTAGEKFAEGLVKVVSYGFFNIGDLAIRSDYAEDQRVRISEILTQAFDAEHARLLAEELKAAGKRAEAAVEYIWNKPKPPDLYMLRNVISAAMPAPVVKENLTAAERVPEAGKMVGLGEAWEKEWARDQWHTRAGFLNRKLRELAEGLKAKFPAGGCCSKTTWHEIDATFKIGDNK